MTPLFAEQALLPDGWARNVRIVVDDAGVIASVTPHSAPQPSDLNLQSRLLLPALCNVHSHAFQRAMSGMTEYRSAKHDDFWTWRTLMYRFLDVLTPDHIEAIAALVYVEMLEAGYAAVGEFHYVHHQPGGRAYDNIAELSERIFAASQLSGIGLTHLPVLYSYGGAGKAPLQGGQLRFGNDLEDFTRLFEAAKKAMNHLPPDSAIGVAPHSLRAMAPQNLKQIASRFKQGPIHIHAAEQVREVEDVQAWLGARPVEYLLEEVGIDPRWCLIHTTQMNDTETRGLAQSGAVAGLCPITEANLGDGIFNGREFLAAGGAFAIGSDSNIRISLSEELRQLEYSQRLSHRARNIMASSDLSTGQLLYAKASAGGAQALQRNSGALQVGKWADLVAIDTQDIHLCGLSQGQLLDGWIFSGNDRLVTDVWSAGRHCVQNGRHRQRDSIAHHYRGVLRELTNLL